MPEPHSKESLASYVGRYVSSKEAEKSFPEKKQRLAVAYSEYKRRKKKSA